MPEIKQFCNGNSIINTYNAEGVKLSSTYYTLPEAIAVPAGEVLDPDTVLNASRTMTVQYLGHMDKTIIGDSVSYVMHHPEGYVSMDRLYRIISWNYFRRDHLGNNVAVWNATADTTVQRMFYYPSGLPIGISTGQGAQPYKYNGKEYDEMHGYDVYDYGFRGYYATIARFTSIDPLCERTPWQSPYCYASNNFTGEIDWMGLMGSMWLSNYNRSCIILGPDYEFLGGINDEDNWIYIDEDGVWSPQDGHKGQTRWMPMGCSFEEYMQFFVYRDISGGSHKPTTNPSDATYISPNVYVNIQVMSHEDYMESLRKKNDPGMFPSDIELYMQNIPEQDRLLITNPVIQTCAIVVTAPYVKDGAIWLYFASEKYPFLQFINGFMEGIGKGMIGTGVDAPYLYDSPMYQLGSDIGSWLQNMYKEYFQ